MTEARIFGEHDEHTEEQMGRCKQIRRVRGGVLCADGHLGYAQPVGGVIAGGKEGIDVASCCIRIPISGTNISPE